MIKDKQNSFISENFKYLAKLSGKAMLSFLKINIFGQFFIIFLSGTSVIIIVTQVFIGNGSVAHENGKAAIVALLVQRSIAFGLVLLSVIISPFLLFSIRNRYVMFKTINRLILDKGEKFLFPVIDKIPLKIKNHQPELFKQGVDKPNYS